MQKKGYIPMCGQGNRTCKKRTKRKLERYKPVKIRM